MLKLLLVLFVAVLPVPRPMKVARHIQWTSKAQVPEWYLPVSDMSRVGPYNLLIAVNGYYCVVNDLDYVRVSDDVIHTCDWQRPR